MFNLECLLFCSPGSTTAIAKVPAQTSHGTCQQVSWQLERLGNIMAAHQMNLILPMGTLGIMVDQMVDQMVILVLDDITFIHLI